MITPRRFSDLGTGAKLGLVIAAFALGLMALTALTIAHFREALVQDRRDKLRELVETTRGLIVHFERQAQAGTLSTEDAQRRAIEALRSVRYGGDGYFWITDLQLRTVMHPIRPEREGLGAAAREPETSRFIAMIRDAVLARGEGLVEHAIPRPGSKEAVPKLTFAMGVQPWGWIVGTGNYVDDIDAAVRAHAERLLMLSGGVLLLILGLAVPVARGILRSIRAITASMQAISAGRTDVRVPALGRRDEIGAMARSLEVFKANVARIDQLNADKEAEARAGEGRRRAEMRALADEFEESVKSVVDQVSSSARCLQSASDLLIRTALEATASAGELAGEAQGTACAVTAVAGASDDLAASIGRIAGRAAQSAATAQDAERRSRETQATVAALSNAAEKVGAIITLINTIAGQTNLLALNATIEAARAGEAGRGFAIVAQEVKTLAGQTAAATQAVRQQIESIQAATRDAVAAIGGIGSAVDEISGCAAEIARSVEEHRAVVDGISRSTCDVASSTATVSANLRLVREGADTTVIAAEQSRKAAEALGAQAETLDAEMSRFLAHVRAA